MNLLANRIIEAKLMLGELLTLIHNVSMSPPNELKWHSIEHEAHNLKAVIQLLDELMTQIDKE